ncbi:hypothetical protein DKG71_38005 [Streptomyces sp. NEAU-S7GS2]|nr:hypothetical protein DKG71_38005 [Streptomyces sp. NEAU-S7GS2]
MFLDAGGLRGAVHQFLGDLVQIFVRQDSFLSLERNELRDAQRLVDQTGTRAVSYEESLDQRRYNA